MDDKIVVATKMDRKMNEINEFLRKLEMKFKHSDYLNVSFQIKYHDNDSIFINLKTYVKEVIKRFNMRKAKKIPVEKDY